MRDLSTPIIIGSQDVDAAAWTAGSDQSSDSTRFIVFIQFIALPYIFAQLFYHGLCF